MKTGRCFELNRVGASVWELLVGPARASQVAEGLAARYRADLHTVTGDVERLLGELERERLVERVAAPEAPGPR
jgi:hypothetical protein